METDSSDHSSSSRTYKLRVRVCDTCIHEGAKQPLGIAHAEVEVLSEETRVCVARARTALDGSVTLTFTTQASSVLLYCAAFGLKDEKSLKLSPDMPAELTLSLDVGFEPYVTRIDRSGHEGVADFVRRGEQIVCHVCWSNKVVAAAPSVRIGKGAATSLPRREEGERRYSAYFASELAVSGRFPVTAALSESESGGATIVYERTLFGVQAEQPVTGEVAVTMRRAAGQQTEDLPLWVIIRRTTEALSFANYDRFLSMVLCGEKPFGSHGSGRSLAAQQEFRKLSERRFLPFNDTDAYRVLKAATEAFVVVNCGVILAEFPGAFNEADHIDLTKRLGRDADIETLFTQYLEAINGSVDQTIPYLALVRNNLRDQPLIDNVFGHPSTEQSASCFGILREKLTQPCMLELIWSYWNEEGMLVQTLNTIARRFQNVRGAEPLDPLANLEIDPLRPLNNLFWGYIQDEQHRLGVVRRNYEYNHHYGLRLEGKAVGKLRAADARSQFLEAFHILLNVCACFFKQDDDTTIVADGFPVLNALKEVHLILSQGAHNQFGDLPSTSRIEMLIQQWLLARPEFREFLPSRVMVAYPEPWMDRVDTMKKLQGWTDTSVLHFRNLAVFGEQILLGIRFGAWSDVQDPGQAANWSRYFRSEVQGYMHAYRAVTGVDLTATTVGGRVDFALPSAHLLKRLGAQRGS